MVENKDRKLWGLKRNTDGSLKSVFERAVFRRLGRRRSAAGDRHWRRGALSLFLASRIGGYLIYGGRVGENVGDGSNDAVFMKGCERCIYILKI